jgi:hypothetical protein
VKKKMTQVKQLVINGFTFLMDNLITPVHDEVSTQQPNNHFIAVALLIVSGIGDIYTEKIYTRLK